MYFSIFTVFLGGILTVFTPCILPVLPVYLGIFTNSIAVSKINRFNVLFHTLLFGLGFSLIFVVMGLGAASVSNLIVSNKSIIALGGSMLIILMGMIYTGILRLSFLMREYRIGEGLTKSQTKFTSFLAGVIFAAGWSPCAGPILGSVLTFVALKSTSPLIGTLLMSVYSLGVLTPFVILSLLADQLLPALKKAYRLLPVIQKIGGVLLILGGFIIIYNEFPYLNLGFDEKTITSIEKNLYPQEKKPSMIFIFSRDCPECKKLKSLLPDIHNDCKDMNIVIKEYYIENEPYLREKFNISTFPTIILFDKSGREVKRVFGSQNIDSLRIAAASILNAKCAGEDPNIDRVNSTNLSCKDGERCEDNASQF